MHIFGLLGCLVANDSVDGGHRGNVVRITDAIRQETVSDFPGKHCRVGLLVVGNGVHHVGGCHLGLGAPDDARSDAASFVVSAQGAGEAIRAVPCARDAVLGTPAGRLVAPRE